MDSLNITHSHGAATKTEFWAVVPLNLASVKGATESSFVLCAETPGYPKKLLSVPKNVFLKLNLQG